MLRPADLLRLLDELAEEAEIAEVDASNVRQQHRLVTEKFGVDRPALVVGWSMGAQQTY